MHTYNEPDPDNDDLPRTIAYRNVLVVFTFALIITYITFIRMAAEDTNNWVDTRVLGYSQTNLCLGMSYDYYVISNVTVYSGIFIFDVHVNRYHLDQSQTRVAYSLQLTHYLPELS